MRTSALILGVSRMTALALADFADDLEVLLEYMLDGIEDGRIVVGEKYAKPFSHSKLHCSSRGAPTPEHLRRWHQMERTIKTNGPTYGKI